jgi:hypothetical protein
VLRKVILVAVVLVVAACLCLILVLRAKPTHKLTLYAYYRHAESVQKGMPVCVDGMQLGSVATVTVRPELGDRPVELVLALNPPYDLKIPAGSTAQIAQPGPRWLTSIRAVLRAYPSPTAARLRGASRPTIGRARAGCGCEGAGGSVKEARSGAQATWLSLTVSLRSRSQSPSS